MKSCDHPAYVMAHPHESHSLRHVPESGYPGYGQYAAPSRFWGEKLGLREIHRSYSDVLGDDHAAIQEALFSVHTRTISDDDRDAEVLKLFERLTQAHPDLPRETVLTMKQVAGVVHGAVSQFSPADIAFFLDKRSPRQDNAWRERKLAVQRLTGGWSFDWIISHETLDLIEARLIELGDDFDILAEAGSAYRLPGSMSA
jgi:hypothetical protein